jgi:Na+-translocating ferredoxin:NAD+ oxidoreductase RnfG subunit
MNLKLRALIHTILAIALITALAVGLTWITSLMTSQQLGVAFMICLTAIIAKIIYDYRLNHLEYQAKLAEMAEKNPK